MENPIGAGQGPMGRVASGEGLESSSQRSTMRRALEEDMKKDGRTGVSIVFFFKVLSSFKI